MATVLVHFPIKEIFAVQRKTKGLLSVRSQVLLEASWVTLSQDNSEVRLSKSRHGFFTGQP